jgi:hypothetical protein
VRSTHKWRCTAPRRRAPSMHSFTGLQRPTCQLRSPRTSAAYFSPSDSKFSTYNTRTHKTKGVGGRSSLSPADAAGAIRLMPFLPDDAPSPSQAN